MMTHSMNRRNFFATTAAMAAPLVLPGYILGKDQGISPNNKINLFAIGMGSQGNTDTGNFLNNSNFRVIGVCDCYELHATRAKERVDTFYKNRDCLSIPKYEDALAMENVDAVLITTPDHWHTKIAVEACQAAKDVYCEKPLTLTLEEGKIIVAAARKYNRVCTSGSQRVMQDYGYMAPVLQSGTFGEIREVFINVGSTGRPCCLPEEPIPAGLDWDRWLGQSPWAPFNAERMSGNYGGGWRRYEDYGNGFLADWGAHKFGGAMYALGLDDTGPVEILPPGVDGPFATIIFKNGVKMRHATGSPHDITFIGTDGEYRHGQTWVKPRKTVEVRRYSGGALNITADFAYCIRHRVRPFQDFLYGACVASACQLLGIAYKLNRPLKWDFDTTQFIDDVAANRLVSRPQRSPYTINF